MPNIIHVKAGVRYWEDGRVDGIVDKEGSLIPFRVGDYWCPLVNIDTGTVLNWPTGVFAEIHYKVCDDGEYWLGTEYHKLMKWKGDYVPEDFLCHGDEGYGDYIILTIDGKGRIAGYVKPLVNEGNWKPIK